MHFLQRQLDMHGMLWQGRPSFEEAAVKTPRGRSLCGLGGAEAVFPTAGIPETSHTFRTLPFFGSYCTSGKLLHSVSYRNKGRVSMNLFIKQFLSTLAAISWIFLFIFNTKVYFSWFWLGWLTRAFFAWALMECHWLLSAPAPFLLCSYPPPSNCSRLLSICPNDLSHWEAPWYSSDTLVVVFF